MTEDNGFLQNAYLVETTEETKTFYGKWAQTYEAEISQNGYVTPMRCATALATFATDRDLPVLDVGCGTGLSGLALKTAGFSHIDGSDLSAEMLVKAKSREGLYKNMWQVDPDNPFPFEKGAYAIMTAVGVLAISHAPPEMIDQVLEKLPAGGLFVFSLDDHTLGEPGYEQRIMEHIDCGSAALMFRELGPHLPGIGLNSVVYVLQKS